MLKYSMIKCKLSNFEAFIENFLKFLGFLQFEKKIDNS